MWKHVCIQKEKFYILSFICGPSVIQIQWWKKCQVIYSKIIISLHHSQFWPEKMLFKQSVHLQSLANDGKVPSNPFSNTYQFHSHSWSVKNSSTVIYDHLQSLTNTFSTTNNKLGNNDRIVVIQPHPNIGLCCYFYQFADKSLKNHLWSDPSPANTLQLPIIGSKTHDGKWSKLSQQLVHCSSIVDSLQNHLQWGPSHFQSPMNGLESITESYQMTQNFTIVGSCHYHC